MKTQTIEQLPATRLYASATWTAGSKRPTPPSMSPVLSLLFQIGALLIQHLDRFSDPLS